eukprot:2713232-Rhodomonas_salina.1
MRCRGHQSEGDDVEGAEAVSEAAKAHIEKPAGGGHALWECAWTDARRADPIDDAISHSQADVGHNKQLTPCVHRSCRTFSSPTPSAPRSKRTSSSSKPSSTVSLSSQTVRREFLSFRGEKECFGDERLVCGGHHFRGGAWMCVGSKLTWKLGT